jgi:hemoglobin-like flavoprotein
MHPDSIGRTLLKIPLTAKMRIAVRPEHYGPVGVALLWTLERGLGAEWTSDLAAAWTDAYALLSEYMIDEAYGRREAAE